MRVMLTVARHMREQEHLDAETNGIINVTVHYGRLYAQINMILSSKNSHAMASKVEIVSSLC